MRNKTSNYYIIKLRYYASEYHLKKWHDDNCSKSHMVHVNACKKHNDFFWSFFEKVTGIPRREFQTKYASSTECAIEELEADHGLVIQTNEGWYTYLIPKKNTELIQWFNDNKGDIPSKVMKKIRICFISHEPTTWKREENKWIMDRMRDKHDNI